MNEQQRLGILGKQTELEQKKFAKTESDDAEIKAAIGRLGTLTADNISKASAKDLATINKTSVTGMLYASKDNERKPAEVLLYDAMKKQQKELGLASEFETPIWKIKVTGKSRDSDEYKKFVQEQVNKMTGDPIYSRLKPNELVDRAKEVADYLFQIKGTRRIDEVDDPAQLFETIEEAIKKEKAFEEVQGYMQSGH